MPTTAFDNTRDPETPPLPERVLSMTDEEGDIQEFRHYLAALSADSLRDILVHLDEEQYPRRIETVRREIVRRRLFFISPYTPFESNLRTIFGCSVGFAILTATLRAIGSFEIALQPWEHLSSWFFDLAVGGPAAARSVLPFALFATACAGGISTGAVIVALYHSARRRMRRDVLATGVVALVLVAMFARLAGLL
jgi:hypothetical protein